MADLRSLNEAKQPPEYIMQLIALKLLIDFAELTPKHTGISICCSTN
jgi:hypothetical protein